MNPLIQVAQSRPLPTVGATSSVSIVGTIVSFAESTLPLIQWGAALVAFISGVIGVLVGAYHLKNIAKKEFAARRAR